MRKRKQWLLQLSTIVVSEAYDIKFKKTGHKEKVTSNSAPSPGEKSLFTAFMKAQHNYRCAHAHACANLHKPQRIFPHIYGYINHFAYAIF